METIATNWNLNILAREIVVFSSILYQLNGILHLFKKIIDFY